MCVGKPMLWKANVVPATAAAAAAGADDQMSKPDRHMQFCLCQIVKAAKQVAGARARRVTERQARCRQTTQGETDGQMGRQGLHMDPLTDRPTNRAASEHTDKP